MFAEVAQTIGGGEVTRRLRDEDLPAVSGGRDTSRSVHVDPDIALVGDEWLAGVQPHPHTNGTALELVTCLGRGRKRFRRRREGDEERITLGVDLDAAVTLEGVAQHAPMLGEQVRVTVAVLLQKPRRALDVREEERDRAVRQRRHAGEL